MSLIRRTLIATAAVAAVAAVPAMASPATDAFQTPSGNIRCGYVAGTGIACVSLSNGRFATLRSFGNSATGFTSQTIPAGWTLGYGRRWSASTFTCSSSTAGVTCSSRRTGHGFFLSRESSSRW